MSFWAFKAPFYARARQLPLLKKIFAAERKKLGQLFALMPETAGWHLDVGSGTGDALTVFTSRRSLICADASPAMLRRLPAALKLAARAECLPFAGGTFEVVSAIGVLEYVQEARLLLQEAHRVARPGGFLLLTSSPRMLANHCRRIWGERLYLRSAHEIAGLLPQTGWREIGHARTWLQEQWLLRRD